MILISFGTRPEYIKIKPLLEVFKGHIPYKLLFTGQHEDLLSSMQEDLRRLKVVAGHNRLDSIVESVMNNDEIFKDVDAVLVQGDTTSVLAVALAAFHRKVKVIHLEAGLRTYNKDHPYPEEFNRRVVSCMADINLCPTQESVSNLLKETVPGQIHLVGNTVLDNLIHIEPSRQNHVVITMHRRENHHILPEWFSELDKLAQENPELDFVLPIHPNPNVQKHRKLLKHVRVVDPMDYSEFLELLSTSFLVITDSGGLQEESSFFKKKCIVCREKTERIEGMGTFSFMTDPEGLSELFYTLKADPIPVGDCPYGDGHSAERIRDILLEEI